MEVGSVDAPGYLRPKRDIFIQTTSQSELEISLGTKEAEKTKKKSSSLEKNRNVIITKYTRFSTPRSRFFNLLESSSATFKPNIP